MKRLQKESRGFAHVGMVLLVVVVIAAIGGVGYYVMNKNKKTDSTAAVNAAAKQAAAIECKTVDKDVCKFFSNWKLATSYTINSTSSSPGDGTSTSTYVIAGGNSHITLKGTTSYEVIAIGDTTTYTKAADGTWWKQTIKPADAANYKPDTSTTFSDDAKDDAGQPITYKLIGKEACGNLTCFKYQVVDPSNTTGKEYIWFDTKDYQLRRERDENNDGSATDSTFSYAKATVSAPSSSKNLGANQVLVPGQSQPETLPSAADSQSAPDTAQSDGDQ